MQRAGPPPCAFSLLSYWLPIPFQCFPHGFPILRRQLHDYFFGLLLDEPRSQRSQLFRVAAKHPPLKLVFAFDFNVGHNYSQHLLVDINSRYLVGHSSSSLTELATCVHLADCARDVAVWLPPQPSGVQSRAADNKRVFLETTLGAEGCA